jgi:GR25 family glycosyltransferase involved in LPS biosynthesis
MVFTPKVAYMTAWTLFLGCYFCLPLALDGAGLSPLPTAVRKHLKDTAISAKNSGMRDVDCIYVINLDCRPEKWVRVSSLLKERGLNPNRFSAIVGAGLSLRTKQELSGHYPMRLSDGEYGCLLSHLSVIRDAYKRGFRRIWVCEDDIDIIRDVKQLPLLLDRLTAIDPKWDMFYTDVETKNNEGLRIPSVDADFRPDFDYPDKAYYLEKNIVGKNLMSIRQRFGMYSFFLSRTGMRKILDYFTHVYLWSAVDIDIHYVPGLREYSTTKDYVSIWYQSPISDIVHSDRKETTIDEEISPIEDMDSL